MHVAAGSEMHAALTHLGTELTDLLGVCALRVRVRQPAAGGGGTMAGEDAQRNDVLGSFEGIVVAPATQAQEAEAAPPLRIELSATSSPRCERCWRHIPDAAGAGAATAGWRRTSVQQALVAGVLLVPRRRVLSMGDGRLHRILRLTSPSAPAYCFYETCLSERPRRRSRRRDDRCDPLGSRGAVI